jgi:hypothetical protein
VTKIMMAPLIKNKSCRQKNATKSNVTSLLNMDGKVTGRSIAYAAVMVRLPFPSVITTYK